MVSATDLHYAGDSKVSTVDAPTSSHLLSGADGASLLTIKQTVKPYRSSNPVLPNLTLVDGLNETTDASQNTESASTDSSSQTKPSLLSEAETALPVLWTGAKDEVMNHPWQVAKSFGEGVAEGAVATAAVVGIASISVPAAIGTAAVVGTVGIGLGVYEAGSAINKWLQAGGTLENPNSTAAQSEAAQQTLLDGGRGVTDTTANFVGAIAGAGATSWGIDAVGSAVARASSSDSVTPLAQRAGSGIPDPAAFAQEVQARTTAQFPSATGADRSFAEFLTAQAAKNGYSDTAMWATENLTEPAEIGKFANMYGKDAPLAIKNIDMKVKGSGVSAGTESAWNVALSRLSALAGDQTGAQWYSALAKSN
jgi:hypothetical protein